jgi:imidazolonepropionase-like amidohydrolase
VEVGIEARKIELIRSVTVINPETGQALPDHDITIRGDRIRAIQPASPAGSSPQALEGRGLFAIPGLIDTHVHALGPLIEDFPRPWDLPWVFRQQRKNLACFLAAGVTTIRDMTSALKLIQGMSLKAARFEILSPRILYAGPMFTVAKGYPYFIEKTPRFVERFLGPIRLDLELAGGADQARHEVERMARAGVACIKAGFQSGRYDDPRTAIPLLPVSLLKVIVDHAHGLGLPVAVHHVYRTDLRRLLEADEVRFDSLEHLTIDDLLSPEEAAGLARREIPVSTTLMTYGIIDHLRQLESLIEQEPGRFERKPLRFLKRTCEALRSGAEVSRFIGRRCVDRGSTFMRENLRRLSEAGVTILYGTDSGGALTPPGCPHWELEDMVRAGMPPLDALKSATSVAADAVGLPDLGRLAAGRIADIVLLEADPLADVGAMARVAAVLREGRLVYSK